MRWAFFESLKIGVQFTNSGGVVFTKISEQEAESEIDGQPRLYSFQPAAVVFLQHKREKKNETPEQD